MSAVSVESLRVDYGERRALDGVSFSVEPGEIFGLLGPNGGGKTTLFRVLSTALAPTAGTALVEGHDVRTEAAAVRRSLGVVFQSPSLDDKLGAAENLWHHGLLYGLSGAPLRGRIDEVLAMVGLADRAGDRVEQLSGGMRRRVEIAKGLLHRPRVLLMDEPSTGLDPGARRDLWAQIQRLRDETDVTILLTTHLLDEAERCGRVAILDAGRTVALDSPDALRRSIRGDVVTVECPVGGDGPEALRDRVAERFGGEPRVLDGKVRIERDGGAAFVAELVRAFPDEVASVTVGQPTLEDVFIDVTGHGLWEGAGEEDAA